MTAVPNTYHVLHQSPKGAVYQCDATNRIVLAFWDGLTPFSARDFLHFRRMVNAVDLRTMALHTGDEYDAEILTPPGTDRCYVLTLCEVVHLRELLNGAAFTLELNTLLHASGCCFAPDSAK